MPQTAVANDDVARFGADIFLPESASRQIPLVGGSALLLGLGLNLRAWLR